MAARGKNKTRLCGRDFIEEQMQDPEFAKAWEETEPEMNAIRAIADASEVHIRPSTDELGGIN